MHLLSTVMTKRHGIAYSKHQVVTHIIIYTHAQHTHTQYIYIYILYIYIYISPHVCMGINLIKFLKIQQFFVQCQCY